MGNGIKEKQSENKFFTIEFFGVTLIVTTFMLLVALIFGEDVLFELGREIQYFLLGVFGYFSYPFLISVNVIGFMLLFGKKIQNNGSIKTIKRLIYLLVLVMLLLTAISGQKYPTDYSSYLNYAFMQGRQGFSNAVIGGWLFSLIAYPFVKYLTYVGAIITLSVILLAFVGIVVKIKINESAVAQKEESEEPKQQTQVVQQPQVIVVNPPQNNG